jgi:hypothetical protein
MIKTPLGFEKFKGVLIKKKSERYTFTFEDNTHIKCSNGHGFLTDKGFLKSEHITLQNTLTGKKIISIEKEVGEFEVYDPVGVEESNTYFSNGVVSHNTEFIGSSSTLISPTKLNTMSYIHPVKKQDGVDFYEIPKTGHQYLITVDCARGLRLDYSAFVVTDVTTVPYKVVAKFRDNTVTPLIFPQFINNIGKHFNNAWILVETNDVGSQVAESLAYEHSYENLLKTVSKGRAGFVLGNGPGAKNGVTTTSSVKTKGCSNFKSLLETERLVIEDYEIYVELTTFARKGDGADAQFAAEQGTNDDLVMCLVLMGWATGSEYWKELTNTDPSKSIYNQMVDEQDDGSMPLGFISYSNMRETEVVGGDVWVTVGGDEYSDRDHHYSNW